MLRILGYTQLYTLVVLMLTSCCQDRQAMERAEQALQEVGERYHAEKVICDSLLDIASSYYLPNLAKGDTALSSLTSSPQQAECMLYEGIRHHDRAQELRPDIEAYTAEMAKAYRLFLEVEQNVELLPSPYLQNVVNNRLALINIQNRNYPQALSYFRRELHSVIQTGDTTNIALANMHLAYIFNILGEGDSTLYYSNRALFYAPHLNGRFLSALYSNALLYQHKYVPKEEQCDSLFNHITFEACTRDDSCRIFCVFVDYYLEKGNYSKADSLMLWTIDHSDSNPELLSMVYLRRSNMFEQMGRLDSALSLRKALAEQLALFRQSDMRSEIIAARSQFQQLQQKQHYEHIVTVIIVAALIVILILLLLWIRYIQQMRQLELRIVNLNATMDQYVADNKRRPANLAQQEANYDKMIFEKQDREKKLKHKLNVLRNEKRALHNNLMVMLRRFFLLKENSSWPPSIYEELLGIYRDSSSSRRQLLDELNKFELSPRQKVICLLISEDKYTTNQLYYFAGCISEASFQSTKSQIKRKLSEASSTSPVIIALLKRFPKERGPAPKPMPQLKNED